MIFSHKIVVGSDEYAYCPTADGVLEGDHFHSVALAACKFYPTQEYFPGGMEARIAYFIYNILITQLRQSGDINNQALKVIGELIYSYSDELMAVPSANQKNPILQERHISFLRNQGYVKYGFCFEKLSKIFSHLDFGFYPKAWRALMLALAKMPLNIFGETLISYSVKGKIFISNQDMSYEQVQIV